MFKVIDKDIQFRGVVVAQLTENLLPSLEDEVKDFLEQKINHAMKDKYKEGYDDGWSNARAYRHESFQPPVGPPSYRNGEDE
jgi:hypothetical protein